MTASISLFVSPLDLPVPDRGIFLDMPQQIAQLSPEGFTTPITLPLLPFDLYQVTPLSYDSSSSAPVDGFPRPLEARVQVNGKIDHPLPKSVRGLATRLHKNFHNNPSGFMDCLMLTVLEKCWGGNLPVITTFTSRLLSQNTEYKMIYSYLHSMTPDYVSPNQVSVFRRLIPLVVMGDKLHHSYAELKERSQASINILVNS